MAQETIAIIGAEEESGQWIATKLAKNNFRLILFAHKSTELGSLVKKIKKQVPGADVSIMTCAAEASWEADIIISTIPLNDEMIQKIKQYVNQKTLLVLNRPTETKEEAVNNTKKFQKLLPTVKVVNVFPLPANKSSEYGVLVGSHDEALASVVELLQQVQQNKPRAINYSKALTKIT